MTITKTIDGNKTTIAIDGRIDTTNADQFEQQAKECLPETMEFILDFTKLEYLSSAGLRIILSAQKQMNAKSGKMVIKNVNKPIMDVFKLTGFVDILTIV